MAVACSVDPLEIPPAVLERFGSPHARPRVIRAWSLRTDTSAIPVLAPALADSLIPAA